MPLDVNKYIEKKKKPTCFRIIRILIKTFLNFFTINWQKYKKFVAILLKVFLWFVFIAITQIFSDTSQVNFALSIGVLFGIAFNYYSLKQNYKEWKVFAEHDEFYKRFCESWNPYIYLLGYLFSYFIGVKYFNNFELLVAVCFVAVFDIWDRRFITSNIKQDLILEKLNNFKS